MKVGDLVKYIYANNFWIVTELDHSGYVVVDNRWSVPRGHLEVVSESR